MNRLLSVLTAGLLLFASVAPVAARSHRSEAAPAPTLQLPPNPAPIQGEPPPTGAVAPLPAAPDAPLYGLPPPPTAMTPLVPPPTRTRKYWELSVIGAGIIGGVYVLQVFVGAFSYAGFYSGQWGWFVPLVGPGLTMGNVGDQLCPCYTKQLYTYGFGTLFTVATVGALVPLILGGVLNKTVPLTTSKVQLVPTLAHDSTGLQLVGRF